MSDDVTLMTTAEVAEEAEVGESEARDWAADNGVQMVGASYAWTPTDVEDFLADLDEAEVEADDEDEDEE